MGTKGSVICHITYFHSFAAWYGCAVQSFGTAAVCGSGLTCTMQHRKIAGGRTDGRIASRSLAGCLPARGWLAYLVGNYRYILSDSDAIVRSTLVS